MSGQPKVQAYLQKHRIGNLFEGMMSKLVKDMPADPYEYLTALIQEKKRKSPKTISGLDDSEAKSHSTSVWASTDGVYDKPWKTNAKQTTGTAKLNKSQEVGKRDWDKTVKLNSKSFDDLGVTESRGGKPGNKTVKIKADSVFDVPTRVSEDLFVSEDDFLAGETATRSQKSRQPDNKSSTLPVKHHPKLKGPKADAARHTQELKAFIESKRAEQKSTDSGISMTVSSDEDEGQEVTENSSDLESEGIKASGDKGKVSYKGRKSTNEPLVTVSICSRCAKVMTNDNQDTASRVSKSSVSVASSRASKQMISKESARSADLWATHRTDPESPPLKNPAFKNKYSSRDGPVSRQIETERSDFPPYTARQSDMPTQRGEFPPTHRTGFSSHYDDADEEFESVSQISGDQRRTPMWTNSDDEDLAPVKGRNMLISPRQKPHSKPSNNGSQRKTVTLKEDILKTLPQSTNTVEDFLGNKTWSGEKTTPNKSKMTSSSRKSHDSFTPVAQVKSRDERAAHKSYDASMARNMQRGGGGWKFDMNSEDESTVVP